MKLFVIGLGPGNQAQITPQALQALAESQVIAGYTVYIDLIAHLIQQKEILTTSMKQEIDRCRMAIEAAVSGKTVSMVCSGDAGVYGMAGLIYELSQDYPPIEIEVIPGITAACSGAAVLGAPLMHDFAVISLSDLLTPWQKIEARIHAAAQADFVICLYNPSSKKRHDYLEKACRIVLGYQSPNTMCGYVKSIGRDGQHAQILSLEQLTTTPVNMFTTVYIGNSQTKVIAGKLVTPRGYQV